MNVFLNIIMTNDYKINISTKYLRLSLFCNKELIFKAPVCLGDTQHPTPKGTFYVAKVVTRDSWLHRWYRQAKKFFPWLSYLASLLKLIPLIYNHLLGKPASVGELLIVLRNRDGHYLKTGIHGALQDFTKPSYTTKGCIKLNRNDLIRLRDIPIKTKIIIT